MKKIISPIYGILITCLVFTYCSSDKTDINTIKVDIDNFQDISLFDIFSKIEIIPLETNDISLIKNITKLISFDDKFFILDYSKGEILIFNSKGNFLTKISDKGEGPNQYFNISDFDIDHTENILILLSPVSGSIYEYDIDGNFKKQYKLPQIKSAYNRLKYLNKDTIVFWTFDESNRIKFYSKSQNANFKESYPEKNNILNNFTPFIFPYDNYLCRASDNTIYEITNNGEITEKYRWDFMSLNNNIKTIEKFKTIPSGELRSYTNRILNSELTNYVFALHGGGSKYLYTQLWRKNKRINVFYDKVNNLQYVFDKTSEDARFYPLVWNNKYVIGFYSEESGSIEDTLPDAILDSRAIKVKENLTEYANPILIKYYFTEES